MYIKYVKIKKMYSGYKKCIIFVDKISGENLFYYEFFKWSLVATPMIVVILFVSLIWFNKWNGRTNME